jgi:acetyl esterase/lipase
VPLFCATEVSRPERFSQRKLLPLVDGMIHAASASYRDGLPQVPGPAIALPDLLRVLEEAVAGLAGTRDPLLDDTRWLEKPLGGLNLACEARYYPGGIHAFHARVWDPVARWRAALALLDRHIRR